ncbi:VOC family protein [Sphingobacterium suaedae]|uniref:VOC family protein n=1 Tax=Sphingobacterium suaedae TaxID=1686402 RepID=A0ABW5KI64_9SPHI
MKIEHIAIWVDNLEEVRDFYIRYFAASSGEKYVNSRKGFTSYFLTFGKEHTRIELMHSIHMLDASAGDRGFRKGIAHFAISVGSKQAVDTLTERLRQDRYVVQGEPRTTGDGYYESIVLDPEGNCIEICA